MKAWATGAKAIWDVGKGVGGLGNEIHRSKGIGTRAQGTGTGTKVQGQGYQDKGLMTMVQDQTK